MTQSRDKREKRKAEKQKRRLQLEKKRSNDRAREVHRLFPLHVVRSDTEKRPCGECQECCRVVAVKEIGKPNYATCQHQCDTGCSIYEQRPVPCKEYYCLYQAGILKGGVENRPDNLGIIIDTRTSEDSRRTVYLQVWETRNGAFDEPAARSILNRLAEKFLLYIRRHDSTKRLVMGPEDLVKSTTFVEQDQ